MAHQSAAPGLEELRAIFTHFDERNVGNLSSDDLRGVLADCGMKPLAVDRVIHALDRDNDKHIGWTEFIAASFCVSVCKNTKLVDAAFAHFDSDGDDKITAQDLERVIAGSDSTRSSGFGSIQPRKQVWDRLLPGINEEIAQFRAGAPPAGGGGGGGLMGFVKKLGSKASPSSDDVITKEQFRAYMGQTLHIQSGQAFFAVH